MSFKVWCLARTGTTPHGRWWHIVIPFIIVAVFVSKNEGRRYVDDIGVVVQQEEKDIHVDRSCFSFSESCSKYGAQSMNGFKYNSIELIKKGKILQSN